MKYCAEIERAGSAVRVSFPDLPGCVTQSPTLKEASRSAKEALQAWLEAELQHGRSPPRPQTQGPVGVRVSAPLALKLQLRWAREQAQLSQSALARKVGVSQQMIAKLEHPEHETRLSTAERVFRVLGLALEVAPTPVVRPPRRRR